MMVSPTVASPSLWLIPHTDITHGAACSFEALTCILGRGQVEGKLMGTGLLSGVERKPGLLCHKPQDVRPHLSCWVFPKFPPIWDAHTCNTRICLWGRP